MPSLPLPQTTFYAIYLTHTHRAWDLHAHQEVYNGQAASIMPLNVVVAVEAAHRCHRGDGSVDVLLQIPEPMLRLRQPLSRAQRIVERRGHRPLHGCSKRRPTLLDRVQGSAVRGHSKNFDTLNSA